MNLRGRPTFLFALGAACCLVGSPVRAQTSAPAAAPAPAKASAVPQPPGIINLNLVDALVAVKAQSLAGVFGFIDEANSAPAMADYLLHNPKAMKLFLKKMDKDLKDAGAITEWDQQVLRYAMAIYSSGTLPEGVRLPKSVIERISRFIATPSMPLEAVSMRRKP